MRATGVPEQLNTELNIQLNEESPKEHFWRDIILATEECTSQKVLRLFDYWHRLRGDRSMPARGDIDAVDIWSLLPNVHLSEWHSDPDRVRYRLAGTELVASIGREISGRWLTEFHTDPKDVAETVALYRQAIARRAPIIGRTVGTTARLGIDSFEWVVCPLSSNDRDVTHFIGLEDYVSNKRYLGSPG